MANQSSNTKLGRSQFASAIQQGLGRAFLHVRDYGLDDIDDLVLDACLHNYCYDTQVETSRAGWLFRMFAGSEEYREFGKAILGRLRMDTKPRDLAQLCALARHMAEHGDEGARQQLREIVLAIASVPSADDWLGSDDWIALEGARGFLELARAYGQRLLQNPGDFVPDHIVHYGKTENEFRDVLFQIAETDPRMKAYKDDLEARGVFKECSVPVDSELAKQQLHERVRKELSLEGILKDASKKRGTFPGRYMRFGRHATPEELETVYQQLFAVTDHDVLLRLLWVFRRARLPHLPELIFRWATGDDPQLRRAAIVALAQVSDRQVHDLAIAKVRAGQLLGPDNDALDMFLNNFEDGDIQLITEALRLVNPDREDAHSLGYTLLDLSEKWVRAELAEALIWAYENTPCSNCRCRAVEQLYEWHRLDTAILHECQFDAAEEIRNFALQSLKGSP